MDDTDDERGNEPTETGRDVVGRAGGGPIPILLPSAGDIMGATMLADDALRGRSSAVVSVSLSHPLTLTLLGRGFRTSIGGGLSLGGGTGKSAA